MTSDKRALAQIFCRLAVLAVTIGLLRIGPAVAGGFDRINQLPSTIEKIKTENLTARRTEYARQLFAIINEGNSSVVDNQTINDLGMLMADRDDSVRYWIAMSLAKIGPHGKQTILALKNALKVIECTSVSKSSEPAIRMALTTMGEHLPKRECP